MAPLVDNRQQFAEKFNAILGNKINKPLTVASTQQGRNLSAAVLEAAAKATKATKPLSGSSGKISTGTAKAPDLTPTQISDFLAKRSPELNKSLQEADQPFWKDALQAITSPLERPFDILSRPLYATTDALVRGTDAITQGEPIWSIGDDVGYGAWRGLSGQDKTGGGDVLAASKRLEDKQGPDNGWGNQLARVAAQLNPQGLLAKESNAVTEQFGDKSDVEKWNNRAIGGGLDVALDPTTYFSGGTVLMAKAGIDAEKAARVAAKAARANNVGGIVSKAKAAAKEIADIKKATPTGADAVTDLARKAVDDVAATVDELNVPKSVVQHKRVAAARLVDTYTSGGMSKVDFWDAYEKANPTSRLAKDVKAGRLSVDDAVDRAVKARPTLSAANIADGKLNREVVQDFVENSVNDKLKEVNKGGIAHSLVGGKPKHVVNTVANDVTSQAMSARFAKTRASIDSFKNEFLTTGSVSRSAKQIADGGPGFKEWHDAFMDAARKGGGDPAKLDQFVAEADKALSEVSRTEAARIHSVVVQTVNDRLMNIPTISFMGHTVKLQRVGGVLDRVGRKFEPTAFSRGFQKAFSYASNFPGMSSHLAQKNSSIGVQAYDALKKEVKAEAQKLTKQERRDLQKALESGLRPNGSPTMEAAYDFIKKKYDEILDKENAEGVRNLAVGAPDYAYVRIKTSATKGKADIRKAVNDRKASIQTTGSVLGHTSDDLAAKGFRVEHDAFKNLLYRDIKSKRDISRVLFAKDLTHHYGIRSDVLSAAERKDRKLVTLEEAFKGKNGKLEDPGIAAIYKDLKASLKPGEQFYLDEDIANIHKKFIELTTQATSEEAGAFIRGLDWITRKFKALNTVYKPGYHVRNFIGDYFMGHLDGVRTSDYATVFKNFFSKDGRRNGEILLGGESVARQKLLNEYFKVAGSSSFMDAELANGVKTTANAVRRFSEIREDVGRFTHFYHAMKEEYPALRRKGMDEAKAWEEASLRAVERVNKFKFDYNALTPFETKFMRRGIPFYTYMRKAVPVLVQSIFTNPKYLGRFDRAERQLSDNYSDMEIPSWMRELSYMELFNTNEGSYAINNSLSPIATLQQATENPASQLHPALTSLFEAKTGVNTFTGAQVGKSTDDSLTRLPSVLKDKLGIFNVIDKVTNSDNKLDVIEKLSNVLGLPLRKVNQEEADQRIAELTRSLKDRATEISKAVASKGYKLYYSDGKSQKMFRVKDETTGKVIYETDSLTEAESYVKGL